MADSGPAASEASYVRTYTLPAAENTGMTDDPGKPPFPGHRRYYVFIKIAVLLIAAYVALRLFEFV